MKRYLLSLAALLLAGVSASAQTTPAQTTPARAPHARTVGDSAQTCTGNACLNLVFDGDSISAGAGSTRGAGLDAQVVAGLRIQLAPGSGGDIRAHNVARGGRPVYECLQLYPDLVAPLFDPDTRHNIIVFHAGDNDIARNRDDEQTYAAFTEYVTAAHHQGWKVVVSTELRRFDFPPAKEAELEAYNRLLVGNAAHADAVVNLDADPRFVQPDFRAVPDLFTADRIHPADGGYSVLAQMLIPAIRRVAGLH